MLDSQQKSHPLSLHLLRFFVGSDQTNVLRRVTDFSMDFAESWKFADLIRVSSLVNGRKVILIPQFLKVYLL